MVATATPELIAHRGWASRFPENTLESLGAALRIGARFVEFDVQLAADDVPVLLHDSTLDRTADVPGCVHDLAWPDLAEVSVGERRRFGRTYEEVRLPSLRQALDLLVGFPGRRAFVEIKTESLQRFGIGRVLEHCLPVISGAAGQCIVTCYSDALVEEARSSTGLPVAWVLARHDEASLQRALEMAPEYLFCNVEKLPGSGRLTAGPWRWAIYEVTEPSQALDLFGRGAGLVETMAIGEMLDDPGLAGARFID